MQKPAKTCKIAQTLQNERLKWELAGNSGSAEEMWVSIEREQKN
jgi:hypothetical protein